MAKAKTEATTSPATETAPKAKRENLFTNSFAADAKKKEAKLRFGFNVVAGRMKKLGISSENMAKIVDILKSEYEVKAADIFKPSANGGDQESFV
jgi:hypothetical protein